MGTLVLVRHGESRWNKCNRFTGWVDVPLSENGVLEAQRCAQHCKKFDFSIGFTSKLERAHSTLLMILAEQQRTGIVHHDGNPRYSKWVEDSDRCDGGDISIFTTETLNERYYGAIQGMDKLAAEKKYGEEKVLRWRRGFFDRPPRGESLEDAFERVYPFFIRHIHPRVKRGETVLVAGHGNTLRAIIKRLENISPEHIALIDLPEAEPLVYQYHAGKYSHTAGAYHHERPLR